MVKKDQLHTSCDAAKKTKKDTFVTDAIGLGTNQTQAVTDCNLDLRRQTQAVTDCNMDLR